MTMHLELRFRAPICHPLAYVCGVMVDQYQYGIHGLSCRFSAGRFMRFFNQLVYLEMMLRELMA